MCDAEPEYFIRFTWIFSIMTYISIDENVILKRNTLWLEKIMDQVMRDAIIKELTRVYWLELEATVNYLAISVDLDGIRAEEIKKSLAADIQTEIGHAQDLAARIKEIGGRVPGSFAFKPEQASLQPPEESTDVVAAIHGVIETEDAAIEQYNKIIRLCDGVDYVTQDLCVRLLADEETHRREFRGFLKEYE